MAQNYVNPDGVSKPANYTHVVMAQGSRFVFTSGAADVQTEFLDLVFSAHGRILANPAQG